MAEEGMKLMPSRQEISEIIERLDRIERIITQLSWIEHQSPELGVAGSNPATRTNLTYGGTVKLR